MGFWGAEKREDMTPLFYGMENWDLIANKTLNSAMMDTIWYTRGKFFSLLGIYCHKPAAYTGLERELENTQPN